jgi:hypothetical protein
MEDNNIEVKKERKPRQITEQTFLKKGSVARSAAAFLEANREYITTGKLASLLSPIVSKLDNNELTPMPALNEMLLAVQSHIAAMVNEALEKAAQAALSRANGTVKAVSESSIGDKRFVGIVLLRGLEQEKAGFKLPQDAERWVDRHLIANDPQCYGKVMDGFLGEVWQEVSRDDAFARTFAKKHGSICKRQSRSTPRLGFGVHAKESKQNFSRG